MSSGKVAVVTGSNKGIGFEVVRALCQKFDGDVYLTARDEQRGAAAVAALQKNGLRPKFHQLDIDDEDSVARLRDFLAETYGGLDVLVNNAAIAFKGDSTAPVLEQAETTIGINFLATRNVCRALFPLLKPHARVVNVSSRAGFLDRVQSPDLRERFRNPALTEEQLVALVQEYLGDVRAGTHGQNGWPKTTYQVSKLALTALTFIQQRRFDAEPERDLVVNAVHPGHVNTDMTSHKGPLSPAEGAASSVYCALLPTGIDSPRGEFVWQDCKIVPWEQE